MEVIIENVESQAEALARLLVDNKDTRKRLRKAVRTAITRARRRITTDMRTNLPNDPRKTAKSVRSSVYKRILGGNVSILTPRKAGARYRLIVKRKLDTNPHQRGGNRRKRSARTEEIDTYFGKDRGFILRFLNSGTNTRSTRYGNRGAIIGGRLFEISANFQMETASEELADAMVSELEAAYGDGPAT